MKMNTKERHELKLTEFLSSPDNEWLNREDLASKVCGITKQTLYNHFTPKELQEIEAKALEIRRTKYSAQLGRVDQSLLKEAAKGDTAAAKLAYQRFEGWSEKNRTELTGAEGKDLNLTVEFTPCKKRKG
jgi:hypothetical protein